MTKQGEKGRKKRTRLPIAAIKVRRLGFECEDLMAADGQAGLRRPLSRMLQKHASLAEAWQRGQFLRNLQGLAGVVETVSEAARKLGLPSGEALREMLDTDREVADLWNQTRLNTRIEVRKSVLEQARAGNQWAIRAVELYLREDSRPATAGLDTRHLMQKEIAELFGVDRMTVKLWNDKHGCPRNTDGSYHLADVIRWWKDYEKRKSGGKLLPADKLRDLKAEEKELDLAARRYELLDREEVIAGLVARWQNIVASFKYKGRELAVMIHSQTVDQIEMILSRFFEELQSEWLKLPEFLHLSEAASEKLAECLNLCKESK